ncbi:hypothetical protein [Roseimaritima ulvae]|uniref:Uncharacterized protein n=1 Tax=Roseimaritima ulvae TaxID=980254 RepID=A0A5B9R8D4_9BACT|nr:hypothetical protein [Roseimaritima ulvae]QEG42863.1 hypothetical protein UC8_49050 [Roseimaritima ulvae]
MQTSPNAAAGNSTDPAPLVPANLKRFVDRRSADETPVRDRRQFGSSHQNLSEDARELALAIDGYKARHRRRYITFEEMLSVIQQLGYSRD